MKVRETKFELLRIVAMLAIVAGHVLAISAPQYMKADYNQYLWFLCGYGARIAVNIFLMLGCWFMVDVAFSARRVFSLYFQVAFYVVPITLLMVALGCAGTSKDVVRGLLPFWGRGLWFASAYIVLLLWAPFLKRAFLLPRRAQALLLTTVVLFTSVTCTLPDPQYSYALDMYWFAFMYLFIGFVKRGCGGLVVRLRPALCIVAGLAIYVALVSLLWLGSVQGGALGGAMRKVTFQWLVDFKTLPNFVASFLIFIGVVNLHCSNHRWVNVLAASTFGVYIIHCVPSFQYMLFYRIFRIDDWIWGPHSWVGCVLCSVVIFLCASAIDRFRARWLAPLYLDSHWFGWLCAKLDGLYIRCGMKE